MEILRLSPVGTTQVIIDLPEIDGNYQDVRLISTVTDLSDMSVVSMQDFSFSPPGSLQVIESLPNRYDADYLVEVTYKDSGELISEDTFELRRPYVNPNLKGQTASDIATYKNNEGIARAIIDAATDGFYYQKAVIETTGLGSDYITVWKDVKKIVAVYENNVLVTDRTFELSKDKSAIVESYSDSLNRAQSAPVIIPLAAADSPDFIYPSIYGFPNGWDYRFVVEHGYTKVPSDIVQATELLVEDISCGKLDYFKRYVTDYNTDQFKIKFDAKLFDGTGNIIVDKILAKYNKSIKFMGVL